MAHTSLIDEFHFEAIFMGSKSVLVSTGSTRYEPLDGIGKCKGDSGVRPRPLRPRGNEFPPLVIESGNSESLKRLYKDRDWWFDNSPPGGLLGDVKVVITMKVSYAARRLLIQQ